MNNNFYEIPNDWYNEFNNTFMNSMDNNMGNNMNIPNMNDMFNMNGMGNMNNDLVDPKTGWLRGNLFNNLYDPYKNYKYRDVRPSNKREEILYDILRLNFAMTDLNLYLDVNPNDRNVIDLYNRYSSEKKRLVLEYEKKYGPLTVDGLNMGDNKFNWISSPWPWEGTR